MIYHNLNEWGGKEAEKTIVYLEQVAIVAKR